MRNMTARLAIVTVVAVFTPIVVAVPALANHVHVDQAYGARTGDWGNQCFGPCPFRTEFSAGWQIAYGAQIRVGPDLTTPTTETWDVTGPCGYHDQYSGTFSNFPFAGTYFATYKSTLPPTACSGTYTFTFTATHNDGYGSASTTFTVTPNAPPGGVPGTQTLGPCQARNQSGFFGINPSGCQMDPVNTATGSYYTSATDLVLPGRGLPFAIIRHYNSADTSSGPLGQAWTHSYAAKLTAQPDENQVFRGGDGQQLLFTHQVDGSFVPAAGVRATLTAIPGGFDLLRNDQVHYIFDTSGRLTQIRDRNGNALNLLYGADGLSTVTDTVGRLVSFSYSGGLLSRVDLPDGRYVGFGYTNGRLTSVRDARGGTTTYAYDAGGRLESITDQNQHQIVANTYGPDGRVIEQLDGRLKRTTFSWDSATQTATMTDARSNQWKDVYSENVLIQRLDPLGNVTRYTYDDQLNLTGITNPLGRTTQMDYDERGNVIVVISPPFLATSTNIKQAFAYTARNDLETYVSGRSNSTQYGYDSAGNLTSITPPGGTGAVQLGRDPAGTGLLTSITDARSKTSSFEYDAQANVNKITSASGSITTVGYDSSGRMTSRVEPRGNVTGGTPADYQWVYGYDAADHLTSVTDPLSHATSWEYDPSGNLRSVTDANTHAVNYTYLDDNRLRTVKAQDGTSTTTYGYDDVGNLNSRIDANTKTTTYGYDNANRLTSATSPTSQVWTFSHDAAGNRTKMVDAFGNSTPTPTTDGTTTFTYDELNRLKGTTYSDGTPSVSYGYDENNNRTSMGDGSGTVTYGYDTMDRLTSVQRGSDTFSYTYDNASNVATRTYPGGTQYSYTYDDDERLATVKLGANTLATYGYDPASNLKTTTLANGVVATNTWDRAGALTGISNVKGSTISSQTLTLDPVGNPTKIVNQAGQSTIYQYDLRDQLTQVCFNTASCTGATDFIRWTYDPVENRKTEVRSTGTTTYTYNASNQLTSATGLKAATYQYNANGDQTKAGSNTFTYDLADRMKTAKIGSTTTTYTYDGDGRRLQASTGSSAAKKTNYLWDISETPYALALERNGSNTVLRRYTNGWDTISETISGADSYYLYDHIGSVANITSSTGAVQRTYTYEPFGLQKTATGSSPVNFLRFQGEYLDSTGLNHLRARQYDPSTGRFATQDPLPPALTDPYVSSYIFVNNLPTVFTDPTGECLFGRRQDGSCAGASFARKFLTGVSIVTGVGALVAAPIPPLSAALAATSIATGIAAAALSPPQCRVESLIISVTTGLLGGFAGRQASEAARKALGAAAVGTGIIQAAGTCPGAAKK